MSIYIEPNFMSKKEANEKTILIREPYMAERLEYLKNHTIAETLKLTKKT